jgi:hypothetical protein
MPVDGSVFIPEPDEAVEQEISEEKAMFTGAALLRDEVMTWITTEITLCDSIDNLDLDSSVPLDSQILAAKALKVRLLAIRDRLHAGFESYVR